MPPNTRRHRVKREKNSLQDANNLLMLAESSSATVTNGNNDNQKFYSSTTTSRFPVVGHPNAQPRQIGNDVNPTAEMNAVIQNIIPATSQSRESFTWNIHSDKVLIDYCSYFLNSDGSIGNDKWAPLAHELGTSAASCRMRWHVLKGSASQATWEQQQQYLRQKLHLSVHQPEHQTSSVQPAMQQPTNDNPARTFQTLQSSTAASTHHQQHLREEEKYFNPEFDAYLQKILWEDDDFVRAVDAIYQEEEEFNNLFDSPTVRVEI